MRRRPRGRPSAREGEGAMNKRRTQGAGAVLCVTAVVALLLPILGTRAKQVQARALTPTGTVESPVNPPLPDPVLEWNANTLDAMSKAATSGVLHSRWAAIVHAAVYDTVVSFTRDAKPYAGISAAPPPGASMEAAAMAAAHFA